MDDAALVDEAGRGKLSARPEHLRGGFEERAEFRCRDKLARCTAIP